MKDSLFEKLRIYQKATFHSRKLEHVLATHPIYACSYAKMIIKGRWKWGEGVIQNDEYINRVYRDFLESL